MDAVSRCATRSLWATSLLHANATDPGFAPGPMAFATVAPGGAGYDRNRSEDVYRRLIEHERYGTKTLLVLVSGLLVGQWGNGAMGQ